MKIGRLFGVVVRLNYSFICLLGLLIILQLLPQVLINLVALITHELAHLWAAKLFEIDIEEVEFYPFGGVSRLQSFTNDPAVEAMVALAGPCNNFFLIGLSFLLESWSVWDPAWVESFRQVNLLIGFFNLIPGLPLDGGRAVRSLLASRMGFEQATILASNLGRLAACGIAVWALAQIISGHAFYVAHLILSFFVFAEALRERNTAPLLTWKQIIERRAKLYTLDAIPVVELIANQRMAARHIFKRLLPMKYHVVLVVDDQMNLLGRLSETQIVDALIRNGSDVTLGEILLSPL